ncbi:hypothetical protein SAMN04489761_3082 [Tenacibaculum sp. MAR_2009_124]|uniref:BACON domain-containing protein n=1 Tax=Tenacibaculum sp. MAR_2009_124 TaxID=1250059 RepID=UPI000898725E|nr:BACON domain-containing protein [Tenacibaculum sp. MAR_2009_124]SEC47023.1 hypothetical protein SAMN04489761_3082 [Tenacibaculum sp. MAR_2009_124]
MPITPSSLAFTYTKGTDVPPYRLMEYQTLPIAPHSSPANGQKFPQTDADWVTAINYTDTTFQVRTNSAANNLSLGTHTTTVEIFQIAIENNRQVNYPLGSFDVTIEVLEGQESVVTPSSLSFEYDLSQNLPGPQQIEINTWRNWFLNNSASWLNASEASGRGDKTVTFNIDGSGLSVGIYNTSLTFNDGLIIKIIPVSLNVTQTIDDELTITPSQLDFQYVKSTSNPPPKTIDFISSHDWTISAIEGWVNIGINTGVSGSHSVEIGVQNLEALPVGEYNAMVTVTNGVITKQVYVSLLIIEYLQNFPSPDILHFTDDENLIQVATSNNNTCLKLLLDTVYNDSGYQPEYRVPFFKGISSQNIGVELANIIGVQNLITTETFFDKPYNEILVNINVGEIHVFNGTTLIDSRIENINFLKGVRPDNGVLSEVGNKQYVTNTGVVSFSFLNESRTTVSRIVVSGAINQTITIAPSSELFYTFRFPLNGFNLKTGDVITFSILDQNIEVVIREKDVDSSVFFWENKWGCFDSLEFTGEYKKTSSLKHQTANYVNNYNTSITKILDVDKGIKHDVNTGWIYAESQIQAIHNMLQSRNIYLLKEGELINVVPKTRNILLQKSKESSPSRKLTFINAEK